jgi:hypothetical protein
MPSRTNSCDAIADPKAIRNRRDLIAYSRKSMRAFSFAVRRGRLTMFRSGRRDCRVDAQCHRVHPTGSCRAAAASIAAFRVLPYPRRLAPAVNQTASGVAWADRYGLRLRMCLRGLQPLYDEFLRHYRAVGLTAAVYAFSTAGRAIRSLSRRRKAEMLRGFGASARSTGASHLTGVAQHKQYLAY